MSASATLLACREVGRLRVSVPAGIVKIWMSVKTDNRTLHVMQDFQWIHAYYKGNPHPIVLQRPLPVPRTSKPVFFCVVVWLGQATKKTARESSLKSKYQGPKNTSVWLQVRVHHLTEFIWTPDLY